MKTGELAVLVLIGLSIVATMGYGLLLIIRRYAGLNRSELKSIKRDRGILLDALTRVDVAASEYREIESPLSTTIRGIIQETRKERDSL